ncbi:hypothetical protein [Hyphomonas sp.]|uniref:hypothetical protein n=1 Tax=Hyphomonas sp. TaxID=87 RepID=UPI003919784D
MIRAPAIPPLVLAMIGHMIREAAAALGGSACPLPVAAARRIVKWLIEPAEAMLRRCFWMVAANMPAYAALPSPRLAPGRLRVAGLPSAPSAPREAPLRFRLTETPRRTAPGGAQSTPTTPPAPPRAPDPARYAARLKRRLDALTDAHANPSRETLRLARLAARGEAPYLAPVLEEAPGGKAPSLTQDLRAAFDTLCQSAAAARASLCGPAQGQPGPRDTS